MTNQFKTTDIVLAAVLKIKGFPLIEIQREGRRGTFVFDGVPSNIIQEFDLGQSLVEPIALNNAIKQLTTSVRRVEE